MNVNLPRVLAFDWLRGGAVLLMLQTHSLVLLQPELRLQHGYRQLLRLDGLVAPSFLIAAGFALALVQVRGALSGTREAALTQSLRRIAVIFGTGTFVNYIWFSLELKWLFRIDILQCIALSLLMTLPVLYTWGHHPRGLRWALALAAMLVFATAPLAEHVSGLGQWLFNNRVGLLDDQTGSVFPLFPWAGYVFLGASLGTCAASMKHEADFASWLAFLSTVGVGLALASGPLEALYPPHHFWVTNPANAAERWTCVLFAVAVLRRVELQFTGLTQSAAVKWVTKLGAQSLSAYFFHQMLLHHHRLGVFSKLFADQAGWWLYWLLVVALIGATWVSMQLWFRIKTIFSAKRLPLAS
jgi:uncharacterized membrane protein